MSDKTNDLAEIFEGGDSIRSEVPRFCEQCKQPYTAIVYRVRSTESYETLCSDCIAKNRKCEGCGNELEIRYLFGEERKICPSILCEAGHYQRAEAQKALTDYRKSIVTDVLPGLRYYGDITPSRLPNQTAFRTAGKGALSHLIAGRGVILYGPTGTAKTRVMYFVLKRLFVDTGRSVKVFEGSEFGNASAIAYGPDGEGDRFVDRLTGYDVLAFDDFGKGVLTERSIATLFAVVEKRMQGCRPIFITTNDSFSTLRAKVRGESSDTTLTPLFRRLEEFCEYIEMG